MCWQIDTTSCKATFSEDGIRVHVWKSPYVRGRDCLPTFNVEVSIGGLVMNRQNNFWSCEPQTLKQAICETKRALKRLANDACYVAKAGNKIVPTDMLPW